METVEIWKDINGYEGLYQISNFGKVKSLSRKRSRKERILKQDYNKGYFRVSLYKNGKSKHYMVHILVANAFVANIKNLPEINHIDENGLNNRWDNLEWCEHTYNLMYGNRRKKVIEKERKPVDQYDLDGKFIQTHYSIQDAARTINRNASVICHCCKGTYKTAYGYLWKYHEKEGGDA